MVKTERNETLKISGKGELTGINSEGISIKDPKEGTIDVIKFDDIKTLLGREITISIQNKELA